MAVKRRGNGVVRLEGVRNGTQERKAQGFLK